LRERKRGGGNKWRQSLGRVIANMVSKFEWVRPGNSKRGGRHSTVDLLIKVRYFVSKEVLKFRSAHFKIENIIFNLKFC
jgi:hypothetical protein